MAGEVSLTADNAEAPELSRRCPRCEGRMMASGSEGDRSCFTCGYIRYATDPASFLIEAKRGRPAHGGKSLA